MENSTRGYKSLYLEYAPTVAILLGELPICWVSADLWVKAGRILDPEKVFFDSRRSADVQVDCGGLVLAPGFVDLQINGAFGWDFSSEGGSGSQVAEGVGRVRRGLFAHGVTALCPTVISSKPSTYRQVLPHLRKAAGSAGEGAALLGAHLEGPFVSRAKRGCHPPDNLRQDLADLDEVYGSEHLDDAAIVTLAPELPNALAAIRSLRRRGVAVSLGHSEADVGTGEAAVEAGASGITHLFNAMLPFHHRDPGLVGLLASGAVAAGGLHYGVIADGIHTHDAALRIAHRTLPGGLVLVTDAIAALGLGDGVHRLGDVEVDVRGHKALRKGTDTLAGSVADMGHCVRHFRSAARCSAVEALEAASLRPAEFLRLTHEHGTLGFGSRADFVAVEEGTLALRATFLAGQRAWLDGPPGLAM